MRTNAQEGARSSSVMPQLLFHKLVNRFKPNTAIRIAFHLSRRRADVAIDVALVFAQEEQRPLPVVRERIEGGDVRGGAGRIRTCIRAIANRPTGITFPEHFTNDVINAAFALAALIWGMEEFGNRFRGRWERRLAGFGFNR